MNNKINKLFHKMMIYFIKKALQNGKLYGIISYSQKVKEM